MGALHLVGVGWRLYLNLGFRIHLGRARAGDIAISHSSAGLFWGTLWVGLERIPSTLAGYCGGPALDPAGSGGEYGAALLDFYAKNCCDGDQCCSHPGL